MSINNLNACLYLGSKWNSLIYCCRIVLQALILVQCSFEAQSLFAVGLFLKQYGGTIYCYQSLLAIHISLWI